MAGEGEEENLLKKSRAFYGIKNADDDQLTQNSKTRRWRLPAWFVAESIELFHLSWSLFLISVFSYLMIPIAMAFCGRLGSDELAAVALSATVLEVSVLAVSNGLSSVCDTVFSQSYGSSNKTEYGVYFIKSLIILSLFALPIAAIHLNLESILVAIGQPPCVARLSGEYLAAFLPGIPATLLTNVGMKYLRCQDILYPTIVVGVLSTGFCALAHYILVVVVDLRMIGSAIALALSYYFVNACILVYILVTKIYKRTWRGWTTDTFQGWGMFLELAFAGLLMSGLEWWAWEISVFSAGYVGVPNIASASILLQVMIFSFMPPLGVSIAVCIRVGQHLGAKRKEDAVRSFHAGMVIVVILSCVVNVIVFLFRFEIPKIFTDEPEVIQITSHALPWMNLIEIFDGIFAVLCGVIKGCGLQLKAGLVMIISFYVVGVPLALVFEYLTPLGFEGYYIGMLAGIVFELVLLTLLVVKTDWNKMVHLAQVRSNCATKTVTTTKERTSSTFSCEDGSYVARARKTLSLSRLSLPDVQLPVPQRLSCRQLVWRRSLLIAVMFLVFLAGLSIRLMMGDSIESSLACALNSTVVFPSPSSAEFIIDT